MSHLSLSISLQILKEVIPDGLEYGKNLLVEFQPDSIWYETSITIAAQALKDGIRTDYHTFQRPPKDVRVALTKLGVDLTRLEEEDLLRVIDSCTVQTGLGLPEKADQYTAQQTLKLSEWSISVAQDMKGGIPDADKRRFHIDDNTGVLLQYNEERAFIDYWRTRIIPYVRAREGVSLNTLVAGVASDSFYKQFEALCDGIIDFKSEEKGGEIEHYFRVRMMRGRHHSSQWRRLKLLENGEVALAE